jgi:hypothetical protein
MSIGKGLVWAAIIFVFGPIVAALVFVAGVAAYLEFTPSQPKPQPAKTNVHKPKTKDTTP